MLETLHRLPGSLPCSGPRILLAECKAPSGQACREGQAAGRFRLTGFPTPSVARGTESRLVQDGHPTGPHPAHQGIPQGPRKPPTLSWALRTQMKQARSMSVIPATQEAETGGSQICDQSQTLEEADDVVPAWHAGSLGIPAPRHSHRTGLRSGFRPVLSGVYRMSCTHFPEPCG